MAYKITSECINCGVCKADCRDKAIVKGEFVYEVVAEKCSDCGACADICPTAACKPAGIDHLLVIPTGTAWGAQNTP